MAYCLIPERTISHLACALQDVAEKFDEMTRILRSNDLVYAAKGYRWVSTTYLQSLNDRNQFVFTVISEYELYPATSAAGAPQS